VEQVRDCLYFDFYWPKTGESGCCKYRKLEFPFICTQYKYKEILKIEESIKELHQLFLEVAVLVEAQGEMIDHIEHNVNQSVAYTKEAVKALQSANKNAKKSRKLMCCLIALCLIIVIIALTTGLVAGFKG